MTISTPARPLSLALGGLALLTAGTSASAAPPPSPPATTGQVEPGDAPALAIISDLTTEIGARMAGTADEAAARQWALKRLRALGFANVHEEGFMMPTWVRGEEKASLTAPFNPQKLAITALGNSGSTGPAGLNREVIYFPSFDALVAAPASEVTGKIVFVDHHMKPTQDGSGYGQYGLARFVGPNIAAKKGAAAIVIRSIGTDHHRNPHAGVTNFEKGVTHIPAGAISNPDADLLLGQWQRAGGTPLTMHLLLTPRDLGQQPSGNVIAEVTGSDPDASPVIIACHLDSWDLATGAIDNAAGCGIITAAALRVKAAGQPRRTIRLLWAGAEEVGVFGGKAYFDAHGKEKHAVAMESDFGADRVWRVTFKLPESAKSLENRISAALAPLGVVTGSGTAGDGADVGALIAAGVPAIDLAQDGTRYFDYHHTPDDTLDKIDPAQLRQNVLAWTATLAILANSNDAELP